MNCGGEDWSFCQRQVSKDSAGQYQFEARRCDVPTEVREE